MLNEPKEIWLNATDTRRLIFSRKKNLLIGNRRKNGNQHKINIPTTIPKVLARKKRKKNSFTF
jgi:hypothetical protein